MGNFSSSDKKLSDIEFKSINNMIYQAVSNIKDIRFHNHIVIYLHDKSIINIITHTINRIASERKCREYTLSISIDYINNQPVLQTHVLFYRKNSCKARIRISFYAQSYGSDIGYEFNTY
ncbi:hypothetical protein [Powai lake megavirus]|uniref:Uncharacterized protein n=1 Tax=Powai lake megavirus TaxID=1842663 RepID=A0A167RNA8_9VIRU|nr:hypothetical protein QJ849_gp750 [Powai lake megavirus]ANB50912.1 hypothetical protein [Powai lake megavirus]